MTRYDAKSADKRHKPSIFVLLLLSMALVLSFTVAAISWVAIDRYTESYKSNTFQHYGVLAKHVAKTTVNTFTNLNFAFLEQSLIDIAESSDIHFVDIVNDKGEIYLSSSLQRRGQGSEYQPSVDGSGSTIEVVEHAFKIGKMDGDWMVRVGVSLDPFRNERRNTIFAFVVTGFLVLLPVLLIAFLIAKYLTAPLSRLVETTQKMSEKHSGVRAQEEKIYEMNELATAFNKMAGSFRLRRFLSPQVADLILSSGDRDSYLQSHRREIATVFCDLRGFTDFSESVEPEEAMQVLQEYHDIMGKRINEYGGTIDHRAGDGIMVLFNDPLPCDEPAKLAVEMAIKMREDMIGLSRNWSAKGYDIGFGVGISFGYATMGVVGFEGRSDYTANGNVVNLASRLCDEARDQQILITQRTFAKVEKIVEAEALGEFRLKGFHRSINVFNVLGLQEVGDVGQAVPT